MIEPTEQQLDDFVRREVIVCLSMIVADLSSMSWSGDASTELVEQAAELCTPVDDWVQAAEHNGAVIQYEHGVWSWDDSEAEFETEEEAAENWCEFEGVEPYQREILEHWAVSSFLGQALKAQGEKVDEYFGGLVVWGRTCSGQSIAMDGVIRRIWQELHKDDKPQPEAGEDRVYQIWRHLGVGDVETDQVQASSLKEAQEAAREWAMEECEWGVDGTIDEKDIDPESTAVI